MTDTLDRTESTAATSSTSSRPGSTDELGPRPDRRRVVGAPRHVRAGRRRVADRLVRQGPRRRRRRPGAAGRSPSFGALGAPGGLGLLLAGPTIATHGTDEQKRALPARHRHRPAGLVPALQRAGRRLRPRRPQTPRPSSDGDEWVVNGQKVWTSGGQVADLGMLIARTDPDVPKHQGITYFALDMHQPGVEVRPLREMTGRALFNEVFLTEARVPDDARHRRAQQRLGGRQHHARCSSGPASAPAAARRPRRRPRRARSPATSTSGPATSSRRRPPRAAAAGPGRLAGGRAAAHRAGQGQRQARRPDDPPGADAAAHARRDRPVQQPAAQGGEGGRPGHPRPAATSPSCR